MSERNKEIARATFEAAAAGQTERFTELYAPDVRYHGPDGDLQGIAALQEMVGGS